MPTNLNLRGTPATDPIRNFRFLVKFFQRNPSEWNGITFDASVGFTSVSGLAMSTEAIPYREGSYNTSVHQIPGQTSFSPVTMQHGVMLGQKQNWQWMKKLYSIDGATGLGGPGQDFRTQVIISVLSHPNPGSRATQGGGGSGGAGFGAFAESTAVEDDHISMKIGLANAWITSLAYSDLSAGDNAVIVEQLTLVHEGMDILWTSKGEAGWNDKLQDSSFTW